MERGKEMGKQQEGGNAIDKGCAIDKSRTACSPKEKVFL